MVEVSEKKVNHWFVKLESRPGMKTESVDKFNGSSMRSEISAILISHDQTLGCMGYVESCKIVKNRSKIFSSLGAKPIIKKEDESSRVIFRAPPKLVVSSIDDENEPVSDPL